MYKIKTSKIVFYLYFMILLITVGRGGLELIFAKKIAFVIQASSIVFLLGAMFSMSKLKLSVRNLQILSIPLLLFIISVFISGIFTVLRHGPGAILFYSTVMIYLSGIFFAFNVIQLNLKNINLGNIIAVLIFILVVIASFEQYYKIPMPGAANYNGLIRPSSITGSKQHYSIILSLLSLFALQYFVNSRKKLFLITSLIGISGVILSLTRSGVMILVLALCFYIFKKYVFGSTKFKAKSLEALLFIFSLLIIFLLIFHNEIPYIERIFSSVDVNSAGNSERVASWIKGIKLIRDSNILFGEYNGIVTNATRTMTSNFSFVVESGVLQLILNFGVIGMLAYYFIISSGLLIIFKKHLILQSTIVAAILSTFVYQSIEVIPFIVLLSIVPSISKNIRQLYKS